MKAVKVQKVLHFDLVKNIHSRAPYSRSLKRSDGLDNMVRWEMMRNTKRFDTGNQEERWMSRKKMTECRKILDAAQGSRDVIAKDYERLLDTLKEWESSL